MSSTEAAGREVSEINVGRGPVNQSVLQDQMIDDITLSWQPGQSSEKLSSVDAVVNRLIEITLGTTPDNGVAVELAKPTGQELVVIVAGRHWCLHWFPEDYFERGCVGSYHTVASESTNISDEIVTYYIQGHHSECLECHTIGQEDAIRAIQQFLASAQRPDCVQWELD